MKYVLLCVISLAAALGCSPRTESKLKTASRPSNEIPVVKTWEELLATPVVVSGPLRKGLVLGAADARPMHVWIGIESSQCNQYEGLLLYVLTEDYMPEYGCTDFGMLTYPCESGVKQKTWAGPLLVQVFGGERGEPIPGAYLGRGSITERTWRRRLFVAPIVADKPGPMTVCVYNRDGSILMTRTITVTPPQSPWFALAHTTDAKDAPLAPELSNAAIPDWGHGTTPVYMDKPPKESPENDSLDKWELGVQAILLVGREYLPQFTPPQQGQLTISAKPGRIDVTSVPEISVDHPVTSFIARWWVNGKSVGPLPIEQKIARKFADKAGPIVAGHSISLKLDPKMTALGAKPGDKISVQLMYSEKGWQFVGKSYKFHDRIHRKNELRFPLVSNVVEFHCRVSVNPRSSPSGVSCPILSPVRDWGSTRPGDCP